MPIIDRMDSRLRRRIGYAALAVALIIRVTSVYFYPLSDRNFSDMANYANIAKDLHEGVWKPTHFFQPIGFAYVVYLFQSTFSDWEQALGLSQSVLSTATLWFMWKAAHHSFGPQVGLAALLLGSVHVPWIALNLFALSETTFTFLLSVLLWVSLKVVERESHGWAAVWGLVFMLAFWIKGTHVLMAPLFLWGVMQWRRWSWQAMSRIAAPVGTVLVLGLALHGLLTYRTIGTVQLSASAGGLNFVEGKCPLKLNTDSDGRTWFSPLYSQLGYSGRMYWERPFTDSSYFMSEGLRCIQDDPLVLLQSFENIPYLFIGNVLWPATTISVAEEVRLHGVFWGCFLIVGLVGWSRAMWPVLRLDKPMLIVWAVPIVSLFLCVYIFKSEIRFRVPFDVFFIPVALSGWMTILRLEGRIQNGDRRPTDVP
jgi:hypothetical protein